MARITSIAFWEIWVPRTIGALALALGLLLATMIWYIHRSVSQASTVLVRGQAIELLNATHRTLMRLGRPAQPGDLDDLLERTREQGLRYVALLGADGKPAVAAGAPAGPIELSRLIGTEPMNPQPIGDRFRMHNIPPRPPDGRGPHHPPPPDAPPPPEWADAPPGGARPPGPPPLVLEFEPLKALAVRSQVRRTAWVGMVAVPLFVLGGLGLAYLVRQRERLTQRIEHGRRLAALGEMSAVIAHEIRNPLASLKGHAQLLTESLDSDTRQAKAARVVSEAVRIQNLISDLLDFSRTGALDRRPVDPAEVLHAAVEEVDSERIAEDAEGAPPTWALDAPHMKQALSNVLRNAVQAAPAGTPVQASVFSADRCLVFEVRDHGPGIPVGEEERIFEPFRTGKTRGTGLGLALVRRIVSQHGGTVVARNDPRGGAVFRVSIPRG